MGKSFRKIFRQSKKRLRKFSADLLFSLALNWANSYTKKRELEEIQKKGKSIGLLTFKILKKYRELAIKNIKLNLTEDEQKAYSIVRDSFIHLGISALELFFILNNPDKLKEMVVPHNFHILDEILEKGKGMIWVTGHIGNWELMAAYMGYSGYPVTPVVRDNPSKKLGKFILDFREKFNCPCIIRDQKESLKHNIKIALTSNKILGLLIDLNVKNVRGIYSPFFKNQAFTITGHVTLALKFNVPIVIGTIYRDNSGKHHINIKGPFEIKLRDNFESTIKYYTEFFNRELEKIIKEHPEQWIWIHNRWNL